MLMLEAYVRTHPKTSALKNSVEDVRPAPLAASVQCASRQELTGAKSLCGDYDILTNRPLETGLGLVKGGGF